MQKTLLSALRKLSVLPIFLFATIAVWAQDKKLDVDINTDGGSNNFFGQPWVWVVGAAVFIIIIVALLRGKK
ncbi:MAG: hypothetical protein ABI123_01955 [Ginsengibacter sp.]|jgi:hypothetical protein